jgi:hypothetical protein
MSPFPSMHGHGQHTPLGFFCSSLFAGPCHPAFPWPLPFHPPAQEKEWAAYSVKKAKGDPIKTPVEDKCQECWTFWKKNFMHIMDWDAFILKPKEEVEAGKKVAAGGQRAFQPAEVGSAKHVGIQVAEHGLFLSESEFQEYTKGLTPKQCKLTAVAGTTSSGEACKGYVVKDPAKPYRTFKAFSTFYDNVYTCKLDPKEHVLQSQADDAFNVLKAARKAGKNGPRSVLGHTLHDLEALQERARQFAAAQPEQRKASVEGVESNEEPSDEDIEMIVRAEVDSGLPLFATPVGKQSKGAVKSSAGTTDGERINASGSSSADLASFWEDEDGDATRNRSLCHWIAVLSLTKILQGSKLGREKGFAVRAAVRMREKTPDQPAQMQHFADCLPVDCLVVLVALGACLLVWLVVWAMNCGR